MTQPKTSYFSSPCGMGFHYTRKFSNDAELPNKLSNKQKQLSHKKDTPCNSNINNHWYKAHPATNLKLHPCIRKVRQKKNYLIVPQRTLRMKKEFKFLQPNKKGIVQCCYNIMNRKA